MWVGGVDGSWLSHLSLQGSPFLQHIWMGESLGGGGGGEHRPAERFLPPDCPPKSSYITKVVHQFKNFFLVALS